MARETADATTGSAGAARRRTNARRLGVVSGSVVTICAVVMISTWVADVVRAPANKSRVDTLVKQVKTDAEIAQTLLDERERQTAVTLRRKQVNRVLAWVLLVSGAALIAAGKQYVSLKPPSLPGLEELVAVRFPAPPPLGGKQAQAATAGDDEQDSFDLNFVDDLVARAGRGREAAIPILQAIQSHYRYLPDEALTRVCELTEITPAQIAGTSSFYAQFRRSPVGKHVVRVCHGTACHVAGAELITQELRRHLEVAPDADTDPRRLFTLDAVACVGCCSLAPVMMIEDETAGRLTPATARQTLDALEPRT